MSKMTRPQLVVAQLFYPAFLGNMTYEAANKLFNAAPDFDWTARFVVLALLAHFVLDWVYTVVEVDPDEDPTHPYSFVQGVLDTFMVLCLYVAVRLVLHLPPALFEGQWAKLGEPALWLLAAKLVALGWELSEIDNPKEPAKWPPIKWLELTLDGGFACLYLALLFEPWGLSSGGVAFGVLVALDAAGYELHARCRQKLKNWQAPAPAPSAPMLASVNQPASEARSGAPASTPAPDAAPAAADHKEELKPEGSKQG